ncbi:MAG: diguanylate cyclase [Pseudomonadota bacterium]
MPGRILVVDDVPTNRIVMKVKLAAARYDVLVAASGEEAYEIAQEGGVDIIIMDMMMPGWSGAETVRHLRATPSTAAIPVILVTAVDDADARMEGLSVGADDFLSKPVDEIALLARVRSLLRTREEERSYERHGVALMDMEPVGFADAAGQSSFQAADANAVGRVALMGGSGASWLLKQREGLRALFRENVAVMGRDAVLALQPEAAPDLFLIDADLGGRNEGLRLMSELRSRQATRHAAFIVLLPAGDSERAATALDLGASDVSYQPATVEEIAMRVRTQLARKQRADRMRETLETGLRLAVIDPLTGLHNRRYGLHHLDRVASRCRAQGKRAGVILMDIDHFKAVNDTYGHPAGDCVLARVALALQESLRGEDLVCRIGGEEFLAVLPDAGLEQVRAVAERLRGAIEALEIAITGGRTLSVTLSLGVAMLEDREDAGSHALTLVDQALYAAKNGGRNRVDCAVGGAAR